MDQKSIRNQDEKKVGKKVIMKVTRASTKSPEKTGFLGSQPLRTYIQPALRGFRRALEHTTFVPGGTVADCSLLS